MELLALLGGLLILLIGLTITAAALFVYVRRLQRGDPPEAAFDEAVRTYAGGRSPIEGRR